MDVAVVGGGLAGLSVAYYLTERATPGTSYRIAVVEPGQVGALTSNASTGGYRTFYPNEPNLTQLAKRSITLLEQLARASKNGTTAWTKYETILCIQVAKLNTARCWHRSAVFELRRPGYVFFSERPEQLAHFQQQAMAAQRNGSGASQRSHGATIRTASPTRQCFYSLNSRAARHPGPVRTTGYVPASGRWEDEPDGIDLIADPATVQRHFPYVTDKTACAMHVRTAGVVNVELLGTLRQALRAPVG